MAWRQHLACKIEVRHNESVFVWEKELPAPHEVPLAGLFVHNQSWPQEKRKLSLEQRKVLWTYDNIENRVWKQAANELLIWIKQLPAGKKLHIDAHHAGAAVILALISEFPPSEKEIHIHVHHAPLHWLQKRFALANKKKVTLKQMPHPGCPWSKAA